MNDESLHKTLALLHEARHEFSHNATDRAEELVGLAVKRLEERLADESVSERDRLKLLGQLLSAVPHVAKLIDTLMQKLP